MIPELQKVVHQEHQTKRSMMRIGKRYSERRTRKMKRTKTAIVSGYFDPLHVGHLEYFKLAKDLADELIVIVNNREQCLLKKGDEFMIEKDRLEIVYHLDMVDEAILAIDKDKSVTETIKMISRFKPHNDLVFCNGGDRDASNSPEVKVCGELGIDFQQGLGKKIRSSSEFSGLVEYDEPNAYYRK
jgi:cytidyltransferase-like protein